MGDKKEILVAEDETHIARLIEFKLQKEGYQVTVAPNGKLALDKLAEKSWDLLILDVMMPVMDGWEVLKNIRGSEKLKDFPVLMLTAKGQQKDMANAAELGATKYLKKPFDPAELATTVKELVG